jgi:hypothetical protein
MVVEHKKVGYNKTRSVKEGRPECFYMMSLPAIPRPYEFSMLLQQEIKGGESADALNRIYQDLFAGPVMSAIIQRAFKPSWPNQEMRQILRYLGLKNFRDRLASLYLHYYKYNYYPLATDPDDVKDILMIEQKLEQYTPNSPSRIFLFFYYLKLVGLHRERESGGPENIVPLQHFPSEIVSLLQITNFKIGNIDWLLLLLWHFYDFLGGVSLHQKLLELGKCKSVGTTGVNEIYWSLFEKLTEEQKSLFVINCMTYGFSINDQRMFVEKIV